MFSCEENTPLPPRKTKLQRARALTTIYGAGLTKSKRKKSHTAVEDFRAMLKNDSMPKSGLSQFRPLPAIGKMVPEPARLHADEDAKVIVFDITKSEPRTTDEKSTIKIHEVLKPLTPLRINGYHHRRVSMESDPLDSKPQLLLRENTYDVIDPIYLSPPKVKKRDSSVPRRTLTPLVQSELNNNSGDSSDGSPRARFKKAAMEVKKLSSVPETGRLLCLRQKVTSQQEECEEDAPGLRVSPAQRLNKLSEIFQSLEVKGRHRDKMKRENNWF